METPDSPDTARGAHDPVWAGRRRGGGGVSPDVLGVPRRARDVRRHLGGLLPLDLGRRGGQPGGHMRVRAGVEAPDVPHAVKDRQRAHNGHGWHVRLFYKALEQEAHDGGTDPGDGL